MTPSIRQRFDLTDKTALVTGASKGIGAAIARALAELGARVVVSSRKQDAVDAVAGEIAEAGGEASAIAAHAGDLEQVRGLVDATVERYGRLDVVVNNAATNPVFGTLEETDEAVFDKIMNVNVQGPLELGKRALPVMREQGGGSVINISSVGGLRPESMLGLYSVSKGALISLTKVMAKEWGEYGVRANAICPGLIKTKFSEALWSNEDLVAENLEHQPIKRLGEPEDMAGLACFLASDAAAYCTGSVYVADGGLII